MNPEVLNLNFFLNVDGEYERFIKELRERLADHPQRQNYIDRYGAWLREHPLLPVKLAEQPARWIHINLIVQDEDGVEETRTTIAVRDDNVYLMGFKNRKGDWYEFGFEGSNKHFIMESNFFLGCDVNYGALLGGRDWSDINLGMSDAISAVRALWGHEGTANPATKRYLARLCVMICEAARMTPHYETVRDGWSSVRSRIGERHARYTHTWRQMSRALMNSACNYPDNMDRQGALGVVKLIQNCPPGAMGTRGPRQQPLPPPPPGGGGSSQQGSSSSTLEAPSSQPASGSGGGGTQQQQGQTGGKSVRTRPLLEVFSVITYSRYIDTIVVFDGKRGQIIYKAPYQSRPQSRLNPNELALSGPYKAISAEGSFAIQVCGNVVFRTGTSIESSRVSAEMLWDCYARDVVYDKVLTHIISTGTGGRLVEVKYAVWSEAVEATIEVSLLLPGRSRTHVYGEIRASYVELDYTRIVLFSREQESKVSLVPSGADSMVPLELGRSVIAAYSCVRIDVHLCVATPNKERHVPLRGYIDFFLDRHTGEIDIEQRGGDIFVPVGSDPTGDGGSRDSRGPAARRGTEQTREQQVKVQVNITSPGFHVLIR